MFPWVAPSPPNLSLWADSGVCFRGLGRRVRNHDNNNNNNNNNDNDNNNSSNNSNNNKYYI